MEFLDTGMDDCTEEYANFVMEQLEAARSLCVDPRLMIEERLDFSRWVPHGFGTGDAVIVADHELHIIDFKYGVGVLVEAEGNLQMRCYALGTLDTYDGIYDIETVKMTIFQPRKRNVSTTQMGKTELLEWADSTLSPTAKLAYEGGGDFKAGDHCRFCKLKTTCRKRAEYNLELARYDFERPNTLEQDEIAAILPRIDELVTWGNDIKEYALQQVISGVKYDGFKVVEGRSIRKYTDEETVASVVASAGYDPYEKKVMGLTAMTRLLGKKKFDELLSGYILKPQGKPVLVPESDKRQPMNTAIDDFSE